MEDGDATRTWGLTSACAGSAPVARRKPARHHHSSCIVVRLAHEGVVLLRPKSWCRGLRVRVVEEARQVSLARRLVEKAITELAVVHATAEDLLQLRKMVQDERDSFSRGDRGADPAIRRVPPEAG